MARGLDEGLLAGLPGPGRRADRLVDPAPLRANPQRAFCFSRLHQGRLRELGVPDSTVLEGEYDGAGPAPGPEPREPVVVFVGRHIPEKRPGAVVSALARAREDAPELRAEIYGDGPERRRVLEAVRAEGLGDAVEVPGRVEDGRIDDALGRALCLVLPSAARATGWS